MDFLRSILLFIATITSCSAHSQIEFEVMRQPARITAVYTEYPSSTSEVCRKLQVEFRIAFGDTLLKDNGDVLACKESNERAIKNIAVVFPPYITFKFFSPGSAMANEERRIYAVADGKALRLGSISDYLFINGQTFFLKYFDWFEVNDLAGHSGGDFRIVIRQTGQKLVLDPELTWVLNHERYEASRWSHGDCGQSKEYSNEPDCLAKLLLSLSMAKVSGRNSYVREGLARSRPVLFPQNYNAINGMLNKVSPESIQRWLDRGQE